MVSNTEAMPAPMVTPERHPAVIIEKALAELSCVFPFAATA